MRGDPLDRFAQLRPAVAPLTAEYVTGKAFTVQPHQRQPSRGGPAEFEGHVLLRVGQAGEADDRGSGRVAVSETQRDANTPADRCRLHRPGHGASRSASYRPEGAVSGVPKPVTGYGRSIMNDLQRPRRRIGPSRLARLSPVATAAHGVPQQQARARGNRGQHEHRIESGDRDPGGRAEPGGGEGPGGSAFPQPGSARPPG